MGSNPTLPPPDSRMMLSAREVNIWNDPAQASCPCVSDHNPNAITFDKHHIVPLAWGGADEDSNVEIVCPNTHRATHLALDLLRKNGGEPPWEQWKNVPLYARELAEHGYELWRDQT